MGQNIGTTLHRAPQLMWRCNQFLYPEYEREMKEI